MRPVADGAAGLDLAWDGTGRDDCFQDNDLSRTTGPPDLQVAYACAARLFTGTRYAPVFDAVVAALALDPSRRQAEPPEPRRPPCQRGRPGCT